MRTQGLAAAFGFLEQAGLKITFPKFTRLCDSVFDHYAQVESKEDKDIPDKTKYQSIVDKLFPKLPKAKRVELAAGANKAFWGVATRNYPIRPSTKGALSHIKSRGLRMGIVSNHHNYDALVGHLADTGIHSHFDVVLASEREGVRKPNPAIFSRSLEALNVDEEHAMFVGDSPRHDIVGAKAMGMRTVLIDDGAPRDSWMNPVGVEPSEAEPDYVIRDLLELREIVDSLLGKPAKSRDPKGSQ